MSFWNLFQKKKTDNSKDKNHDENDASEELLFAKNFTEAGGKFIYIDKGDSIIDTFVKIKEENQWDKNDVKCISPSLSKNLGIKKTKDIAEENSLKALVNPPRYYERGLSPTKKSSKTVYQRQGYELKPKRTATNKIEIVKNVNQRVDDYIVENFADMDLTNMIATVDDFYSSSYCLIN